jgi:hypothetical protein
MEKEGNPKEKFRRNSDGIQSSSMAVSLFAALIDSAVELEMGDGRVLAELLRGFETENGSIVFSSKKLTVTVPKPGESI